MRWLGGLVAVVVMATGTSCGGGKGAVPQDVVDAAGDSGPDSVPCVRFKVVGAPCHDACECLGSLCLLNEMGPDRFCSKSCGAAQPGQFCAPEQEGDPFTSLCVEFPSDFRVPPSRFCAPLCKDLLDCMELGIDWEDCRQPVWKGNPLYPAQPDQICISTSAQGHDPIDPDTCEGWEVLFNEFEDERFACIKYCEYLDFCQKAPTGNQPPDCCAFDCASSMISDGKVDKDAFQKVRCYSDNYQAFSGTALVCTKPEEACGQ